MWIARDKDGYTAIWSHKPIRGYEQWYIDYETYGNNANTFIKISEISNSKWLFPTLKWEDEPIEINIDFIKDKKMYAKCYHCKKEFTYSEKDLDDSGIYVKCPDCNNDICILE